MANASLQFDRKVTHTTSTADWETLVSIPVLAGRSVMVHLQLLAHEGVILKAQFDRTGSFFRTDGPVFVARRWEDTATRRTEPGFDVRYQLLPTEVLIQIKSSSPSAVLWKGVLRATRLP